MRVASTDLITLRAPDCISAHWIKHAYNFYSIRV